MGKEKIGHEPLVTMINDQFEAATGERPVTGLDRLADPDLPYDWSVKTVDNTTDWRSPEVDTAAQRIIPDLQRRFSLI